VATKTKTMEVCDELKELLASESITTPEEEKEEEVVEKEIVYTPIVMQILGINEQLADLDDYFNELPNLQSQIDEELSDLLHYIENNDLTPKQSTKMIKLLKQKRTVRRGLCNDYEIKKVYNAHKGKLAIDTQRPFFLNEIHKKVKELNSTYKSRQLSDEQIKELIK
jgi:hypothetical protein